MLRYDEATKTISKFPFQTEPHEFGPKLDADIALIRDLALRSLHVFPWVCMLPFLGEAAHDLFLRRMETRNDRLWFQAECNQRHPELERRLTDLKRVAASTYDPARSHNRVSSFSFPEILVGSALRAVLPPFVRITAHTQLPGSSRVCDFELQHVDDAHRIVRVEVAGMMTASGEVLTQTGVHYRERQPERLAEYGRAGVSLPLMCYADQIWYRPGLRGIVTAVRNGLGLSDRDN